MRDHAAKDVHAEVEHPVAAIEEPKHDKMQFAGGQVPPVQNAHADAANQAADHHTASQLAFEEDDHTRELKSKVHTLVASKFGGDFKAAFDHYDGDKDGSVNKDEIIRLLSDAGVGNGLTRGKWASGILEKLDANGNGGIEWGEFEKVFGGTA